MAYQNDNYTPNKQSAAMILQATIRDDSGAALGALILNPKDFKTGSKGFFGMGKLDIGGKKYQAQVQLVEIGSKGASTPAPEAST